MLPIFKIYLFHYILKDGFKCLNLWSISFSPLNTSCSRLLLCQTSHCLEKHSLLSVQITPAYSLGLDKNITSSHRTCQTSLIRISLLATHSRAPKWALARHSLGFIEVAGKKSVSLMDSAQWRQCHLFPTVSSVHGNMSDI